MDLAKAKIDQAQQEQIDALNEILKKNEKMESLVDKVDEMTIETKLVRKQVRY